MQQSAWETHDVKLAYSTTAPTFTPHIQCPCLKFRLTSTYTGRQAH